VDFTRVLVVSNFIHPFYENVGFIRDLYEFPNIRFYGDDGWPVAGGVIPYNQSDRRSLKSKAGSGGMFAYRCMLEAVRDWPEFSGYLFLMDDVLISRRKFRSMDERTAYLSLPGRRCDIEGGGPSDDWHWWKSEFGIEACRRAYARLPGRFKSALARRVGGARVFVGQANDCFYLPRRLVPDFVEVFSTMSDARVFTEIAIPTGFAMIEPNLNEVGICYLWNRRRWLWPLYGLSPMYSGIHPVKFSGAMARRYASMLKMASLV